MDALLVVAYTMPALLVDLLPVTVLLGGLLGRGAGEQSGTGFLRSAISLARISSPIIKLALVLIAMVMALQNWVIPTAEYSAAEHRAKTLMTPGQLVWRRSTWEAIASSGLETKGSSYALAPSRPTAAWHTWNISVR